jgi:hypothetical protein
LASSLGWPGKATALAVCVDSGGTNITLTELDVIEFTSDAEAFLRIKKLI